MRVPRAILEPDTGGAPPLLRERALGLRVGDPIGLGWIPALREVPETLLAAPADDRDLPANLQELEHDPHVARAPPRVLLPPLRRPVLELAPEQGATPVELA